MRVEVPVSQRSGRALFAILVIAAVGYPWSIADAVALGTGWTVGLAVGSLTAVLLALGMWRRRLHPLAVEVDGDGIRQITGRGKVWWAAPWESLWRIELGEGPDGPQFRIAGRGQRRMALRSTPELNEALVERAREHGVRVVACGAPNGPVMSQVARIDRRESVLWILIALNGLLYAPAVWASLTGGRAWASAPAGIAVVGLLVFLATLPRPYTTRICVAPEGVDVMDERRNGTLHALWRYEWRDVTWLTARRSFGDVIAEVQIKGASNTERWRLDPDAADALVDAAASHGVRAGSQL